MSDRQYAGFVATPAVRTQAVPDEVSEVARQQLKSELLKSILDLPIVQYTDVGFDMVAEAVVSVLRKAQGVRAPERRRPRRVQRKIDKRDGALHYGAVIRPLPETIPGAR